MRSRLTPSIEDKVEKIEPCCPSFESYIPQVNWFPFTENGQLSYVMPHVISFDNDGKPTRLRINSCPFCGAKIRTIRIDEGTYLFLKNKYQSNCKFS